MKRQISSYTCRRPATINISSTDELEPSKTYFLIMCSWERWCNTVSSTRPVQQLGWLQLPRRWKVGAFHADWNTWCSLQWLLLKYLISKWHYFLPSAILQINCPEFPTPLLITHQPASLLLINAQVLAAAWTGSLFTCWNNRCKGVYEWQDKKQAPSWHEALERC